MVEGQTLDIGFESEANVSLDDYSEMIEKKSWSAIWLRAASRGDSRPARMT